MSRFLQLIGKEVSLELVLVAPAFSLAIPIGFFRNNFFSLKTRKYYIIDTMSCFNLYRRITSRLFLN